MRYWLRLWLCVGVGLLWGTSAFAVSNAGKESYALGLAAAQDGNYQTAIQYLQLAVQKGEPHAYAALGNIYSAGPRSIVDFGKAKEAYEQAALRDDVEGWYGLGKLYAQSLGVTKSEQLAVHYYVKAAGKYHVQAAYALGMMYAHGGANVAADAPRSRQYLEQSCLGGWGAACRVLKSK